MAIYKNGEQITDLNHWSRVAGPKSDRQWVEGRSAMEAARYWLSAPAALPLLFAGPLNAHRDFGSVLTWVGEPEVRLAFDRRRGEPRNTDLLIECKDSYGPYLLAIEAKADETFGETVGEALTAALERSVSNPRSQALERIRDLVMAILPPKNQGEQSIGTLRYQLLTASAGALAEGTRKGIDRVILVVQEFRTSKTDDARQAQNARDLASFVSRVGGSAIGTLPTGQIMGAFNIPGVPLFKQPPRLYILKVVCDLSVRGIESK